MISPEFKNTIKNHLDELAKVDDSIREVLLKPNKSIEECCSYIIQEVKRMNYTAVADEDVYAIAITYYKDDSIKDVEEHNVNVVVPSDVSKKVQNQTTKPAPTANPIPLSTELDLFDV